MKITQLAFTSIKLDPNINYDLDTFIQLISIKTLILVKSLYKLDHNNVIVINFCNSSFVYHKLELYLTNTNSLEQIVYNDIGILYYKLLEMKENNLEYQYIYDQNFIEFLNISIYTYKD